MIERKSTLHGRLSASRLPPPHSPARKEAREPSQRLPTALGGKINILIVDDEPKNLTVLETVLDNPDYRLVRAQSANEALMALVTEEFALLILDIRMPDMTGFELAQMIKERRKTADIPIIFLTAFYNDDQHVLEGYVSGAVDYLHKPVNAAVLRSKVAVFAEMYRRSRESALTNRMLLTEITERRKAQEQLRVLNETLEQRVAERTAELHETDARYRSLFDSSLDAIISVTMDGRFATANPAALQLTGRTLEELQALQFLDVIAPDQRDLAERAFRAALLHECITLDTAIIAANGERCEMMVSGAPTLLSGELVGLSCIARDITERKRIEVERLASEAKFRALLESAPDAMVIVDHNRSIVLANAQTEHLFGYPRDEILGQQVEMLMPALFQDGYEGYFAPPKARAMQGGLGRRKDGSEFPIEVSLSPLATEKGTLICSAVRDITDRKHAESELKKAKLAAEKANQAKSDFLSSMSHELRTPLNAVLGFAQLIEAKDPPPTPSQQRSLNEILKAGWYLLELINEILDLAQVESGNLVLSLEPIALTEIMQECLTMIDPQAKKHSIQVISPELDINYWVQADRTRLKQTLLNLLSNAIKYNKKGGSVVVSYAEPAPGRIGIAIEDTGAGLSVEKLAQLFQPFNRLGQESNTVKGTGIGLVVCKRLVEMMGGKIGVQSTVGQGSVFWIELNLTKDAEQPAPRSELISSPISEIQADAPMRTLLYVEDNRSNLKLIQELLAARRPDIRLLSATNGKHGLEVARSAQPDVILMDINLPDISGIKAMTLLRADAATAHIPVVALSANAMQSDIQSGLEAGFFRYVTKPIKINEFMEALDGALQFAQAASAEVPKQERAQ